MSRIINISKSDGATVVSITASGKTSIANYIRDADIFLLSKTSIAVIDSVIPFFVFDFHEIDNPYEATSAIEYLEVMNEKGFFKKDITGGGAINYIQIEGNSFEYKPITSNDGSDFEIGDLALNGWINENEFGKILAYTGGNPELFESWEVIESV